MLQQRLRDGCSDRLSFRDRLGEVDEAHEARQLLRW
jgi:hypothetical protein